VIGCGRGGAALDLETLANLGEFVSGVVVVVSLVVLAHQMRQNTLSLRTENYARALERLAAIQGRLSGDEVLAPVFARGVLNTQGLSPEERIRFTWAFYEMFGAFEFMFHQAKAGAMPDEVWTRWSDTLSWWISLPGVAAWWRSRPTPFSASFTAFVEGCLQAGPADPEAARRWARFLAGGATPAHPGEA
jgi:hypothetical protein